MFSVFAHRCLLTIGLLLVGCLASFTGLSFSPDNSNDPPKPVSFEKEIRPLIETHCFKCHGPDKQKGKVNLALFADEKAIRKQRKLWRGVASQIESLEMPPMGQPALPAEQRKRLVRWIKETVERVDCDDPADRQPARAPIRRLCRSEYNHTIRDLLNISFDAGDAVGMSDDAGSQGYATLAEALNLPPVLMEKYFAAADKALEKLCEGREGAPKPAKPDANALKKAREAYQTVFFVKPGVGLSERDAARQIMTKFMRRAYRRPVQDTEIDRFLKLYDRAGTKGMPFDESVRLMLKAVLVSPHYLFRLEQDQAKEGSDATYPLSDHELAVRLSYFLWSSMPDEELSKLADAKKLSDPATLEQQVRRMLADAKAHALTDDFATQWLQLRKLADARPSTEFFPTFTPKLRQAMFDEATTFFDKLREGDRSIKELLDADYTYLNQDLAKHYGVEGVEGPRMRRVTLKTSDHRGGLLGMAAMLSLTSHTSRTSPTLRGKWVLEVIFGTPPPPPPPDAGQLADDPADKKKTPKTFRERLAQHAAHPSCAACHAKIDPLGFGLENFDAIGRWREPSQDFDASGQLPGGVKFNGPAELKGIIVQRQDAFIRNLTEQMLIYALGRDLQSSDECAIKEIKIALGRNDYHFSELVLGVVKSQAFRYRRNTEAGP